MDEVPSIEEIPLMRKPSVNWSVGVSRGCPRKCRFCSVTSRPLRYCTLEMVSEEVDVDMGSGVRSVVLHSDGVLLYGSDSIHPNEEALMKLHELVKSKGASSAGWSHFSLSALRYAEEEHKPVSRIGSMPGDY